MFTGIIATTGAVQQIDRPGGDARLRIGCPRDFIAGVALGDSIAVSGACLTVVEFGDASFAADVSNETLELTTLGARRIGDPVNLEKSLTPSTPLGGHFVTGHVDGVGRLVSATRDARSTRMRFEVPTAIAPLVAAKGSIAIDGISLTVNAVDGNACEVNIVPHTMERTTLGSLKPGAPVNVEADLLARYLARLASAGGLCGTRRDLGELLRKQGFA